MTEEAASSADTGVTKNDDSKSHENSEVTKRNRSKRRTASPNSGSKNHSHHKARDRVSPHRNSPRPSKSPMRTKDKVQVVGDLKSNHEKYDDSGKDRNQRSNSSNAQEREKRQERDRRSKRTEDQDKEAKGRVKRSNRAPALAPGAVSSDAPHPSSSKKSSSRRSDRTDDRDIKRKAARKTFALAPGAIAEEYNPDDGSLDDLSRSRRSADDPKGKERRSRKDRPIVPGAVSANEGEGSSDGRESRRRRKEKEASKSSGGAVRQKGAPIRTKKDALYLEDGDDDNAPASNTLEVVPEAMMVEIPDDGEDTKVKEFDIQGNPVMPPPPPPPESNIPHATHQNDGNHVSSPAKPYYTSPKFWVLILLILGGAGAAVYFFTKGNATEPVAIPGVDTTITDLPTPSPTTSISSGLPSTSPTDVLEIKPPTPEDCLAVSRGEPVEVRQDLIRNLQVPMDILLSEPADSEAVAAQLERAIQESLVPEMMGCDLIGAASRRNNMRRGTRLEEPRRYLQLSSDYSIGNAKTTVTPNEAACTATDEEPCLHVIVSIVVYLKGPERAINLQNWIQQVFGEGDELMAKLSLEAPIQAVFVFIVEILQNTLAPSALPSFVPSVAPSALPSATPSTDSPSNDPTLAPVVGPTTPEPTIAPSIAPSANPSSLPTPGPTVQPTLDPSETPSSSPTPRPTTGNPTPPPTPPPTGMGSATPSIYPTVIPSSQPSRTPTLTPTSGPTNLPTNEPSKTPTGRPTTSPSSAPSTPAPSSTPDRNCGPLWGGSKCSCNGIYIYCHAASGTCGDTAYYKNSQGTDWDCPNAPDIPGRCGPLFGGRACDCGSLLKWCNEDNGWCGNTVAHRDMQSSITYDCPADYPPSGGSSTCKYANNLKYGQIKPMSNTNLCLRSPNPRGGTNLEMATCNPFDNNQFWAYDSSTRRIQCLAAWNGVDTQCIDPEGPSLNPGTALQTWSCGTSIQSQHRWAISTAWQIESKWLSYATGCLDLGETYPQIQTCNAGDSGQVLAMGWYYC
ncbi:unnamed protein product [Cylindrotheca closterium]|uniref:Ricin B lectin domain-containing protein n=1 Tax=Cylindrotheca closterium TaxID=2856 RepID=A0AAD2G1X0_9STRA|nr:unnamed protein product [Cylindrotheca closterium]